MITTVNFNNQTFFQRNNISNVVTDNMLPQKSDS